ncbi:MAG: diaminopimelate epimerase [Lachnospiraceae bacterium]|nr:diaminopimelate epimerase [Lachnospiraceae bacterium]
MRFTKMHGIGNDYVYVNCLEEEVPDPGRVARLVSDRHFGVGSDGLILIRPSKEADFCMDMYNADGSQGAMCGNGIRCVGKYVYDHGLTGKERIRIETKSGVKSLELTVQDGKVRLVKVGMGAPDLSAKNIPISIQEEQAVDFPIQVDEREFHFTGVSMGNPHAVVYVEDVNGFDIEKWGPKFEGHPMFPDRVNTEFCKVLDEETIQMRVWERGAGETMACGTGACAAAVSSILNGHTKDRVTVKLLGGDLQIHWDRQKGQVYMTGPAAEVFSGQMDIE